jgi:hypothetical protein
MRSVARGSSTSTAEVTNVSAHGLWLLIDERELFLAFRDFPWFADATIHALTNVERPSAHHLHWPALDVDLAVESLTAPERYPLVSRVRSNKRLQLPRAQRKPRKAPAKRARLRS